MKTSQISDGNMKDWRKILLILSLFVVLGSCARLPKEENVPISSDDFRKVWHGQDSSLEQRWQAAKLYFPKGSKRRDITSELGIPNSKLHCFGGGYVEDEWNLIYEFPGGNVSFVFHAPPPNVDWDETELVGVSYSIGPPISRMLQTPASAPVPDKP